MTICAALLAATLGLYAQKTMKAPAGGKAISDELIGIFFEDISSSADGGLYAELIQNGSFEYNPSERDGWGPGTAWKIVRPGHSLGRLDIRMTDGLNANNPTYMRLHTERAKEYYDYRGWTGYGIQNDGFDGISVKAGEKYDFSAFLRNIGAAKKVRVALIAQPQGRGGGFGFGPRDPKLLAELRTLTKVTVCVRTWLRHWPTSSLSSCASPAVAWFTAVAMASGIPTVGRPPSVRRSSARV